MLRPLEVSREPLITNKLVEVKELDVHWTRAFWWCVETFVGRLEWDALGVTDTSLAVGQ